MQNSFYPESEEDEMENLKSTLKNFFEAEEISIKNRNQMIEALKSQKLQINKKTKNFLSNILTSPKLKKIEEIFINEPPLIEPQSGSLKKLESIHQLKDIINADDSRIKSLSNFLNLTHNQTEENLNFNPNPNPKICKSPLLRNELINIDELSFIFEDEYEGIS